jgi:hypothetical protein
MRALKIGLLLVVGALEGALCGGLLTYLVVCGAANDYPWWGVMLLREAIYGAAYGAIAGALFRAWISRRRLRDGTARRPNNPLHPTHTSAPSSLR